jgi:plasmid stabilization system protein ParE
MMGGSVRFSKLAERDLIDIAEHTLERWGEA